MTAAMDHGRHGGNGELRSGRDDLHRLLEVIQERRTALIDRLSRHPASLIALRPASRAWSLRDVAEHLVLADQATLDSIVRNQSRPPLRRRWHHRPVRWLIGWSLESRIRIPYTGRILTPAGTALSRIALRGNELHRAWQAYLDRTPIGRLNESVFRHPLGVPMTAAETLVFLRRHHEHHLHQVERIERSSVFMRALAER